MEEEDGGRPRLYLAPLDGLRFLAFFAVLLHHVPTSLPWLSIGNQRGWLGVELFFVISSFLFFTLFQREYEVTGRIGVTDFFLRRLLRLYPLLICAPLLFMALGGALHSQSAWRELEGMAMFVDNITSAPTFSMAIPYADHLWTLSFEFQVYLVLPFLFYACVRLGRTRALMMLAILWLCAMAARAHYAMQPHPFIYFSPWLRPDSILMGMALAILAPVVRGRVPAAAVALVGSLALFLIIPNVHKPGPWLVALYPVAAVACGSLLWLALRSHWLSRVLSSRPAVFMGQRSYGLYVFHLAAIHAMRPPVWLESHFPLVFYVAWLVAGVGLTAIVASVSYRYFERPFLKLKDARAVILTRPV